MRVRRLLILTAVLLGMTTLAAALAPRPATRTEPAPRRSAPAGGEPALPAGEEVRATLSEPQGKVRRVRAQVGDVVRLSIEVNSPGYVAIDDLAIVEPVDPDGPTEIEVLADRAGEFEVVLSDRRRRLGVLEVAPRR